MPFFRVFRVFRAWLWAKGIRWHTVHTAGSWARGTRCTRYRGARRQCAYVVRIVCRTSGVAGRAGRVGRAGQTGRAGQAGRAGLVGQQDERGAYGSLFYLSFLDYPFCEHVLRRKNAPSRLQGRFTPPRATRWLLPKNDNMLLNFLLY